MSKDPSASIKPDNQAFSSKLEVSLDLQMKLDPLLLFIHSIKLLKCSILGPLNLPFIKLIILFKSEIDDIVQT